MRVGGGGFLVALAMLAPVSPAASQKLDIVGEYGNEAGCRYVRGVPDGEEGMLMMNAEGVTGYATSCEFVQMLTARDGSMVVTSICDYEGEEGRGPRLLVISRSDSDPSAFRIHVEHGELWDEVRPCS